MNRRGFLTAAGGIAAAGLAAPAMAGTNARYQENSDREPFFASHQGGIATAAQTHCYIAALDITAGGKLAVASLLQRWTEASAKLTLGLAAGQDSGDATGLSPARLTLTFGFGAGLFVKDDQDRFGLASRRPEAFVDLPHFPGDQLIEAQTGGDLLVQACADDPQVAFHAVRQLIRLAYETAELRWVQSGFIGRFKDKAAPRNLMGFKDGTGNPLTNDRQAMDQHVWVGPEAPGWMQGGSYMVVRRSRMALEHWDRMNIAFQEQTFGRQKSTGAPLGKIHESDPPDFDATDKDGNPVIPENAHVRLAAAANNAGVKMLRRSYSYNDGVNFIAERWPPWHQGMEYDAGLIFVCFQRDPRRGFIAINDKLSRFDMMNQFVTVVGGGIFACPGGVTKGRYIGQALFESV